ncbi:GtrA-like protein [Rhizobiales bacterium GAS113]|nr:GtrA-like protein [Rhizobiales bacterium GAS113]
MRSAVAYVRTGLRSGFSSMPPPIRSGLRSILKGSQFRLLRYMMSGVAVSLGYTLTTIALVSWLHWQSAALANAVSLTLWTVISFVVHRDFTFAASGTTPWAVARFVAIFVLKLVVSVVVVGSFAKYGNGMYLVGVLSNWIVLPLISYTMLKVWVFNAPEGEA